MSTHEYTHSPSQLRFPPLFLPLCFPWLITLSGVFPCSHVSVKQSMLHSQHTCWLFMRAASSYIFLASNLTFPIMIDGKKSLDFLSLLVLYLTFAPACFPWRVFLHISPGIRTAGSPTSCLIRSSSSWVYINNNFPRKKQILPKVLQLKWCSNTMQVSRGTSTNTQFKIQKRRKKGKKELELLQQTAVNQRHLEKQKTKNILGNLGVSLFRTSVWYPVGLHLTPLQSSMCWILLCPLMHTLFSVWAVLRVMIWQSNDWQSVFKICLCDNSRLIHT